MFFGKIVSKDAPFQFSQDNIEQIYGEVFSLTNITLAPTSKVTSIFIQDSAQLYIKKGDNEFLVASLTKEKPHTVINVFVSLIDEVTLIVKGNGIIHVTGFCEPEPEGGMPFDDLGDEEDDEELEDSEEEEEQVEVKPKAQQPKVKAQP